VLNDPVSYGRLLLFEWPEYTHGIHPSFSRFGIGVT